MTFSSGFSAGMNAMQAFGNIRDKRAEREKEKQFNDQMAQIMGSGESAQPAAQGVNLEQQQTVAPQGAGATQVQPVSVNQTQPVAAGATVLNQPQQAKPQDFNSLYDKYNRLQALAVSNPDYADRTKGAMDMLKQQGMRSYMAENVGDFDPNDNDAYLKHIKHYAKAQSMFGDPVTPEQYASLRKINKEMQESGFNDAIDAAWRGDKEATQKAWNSSSLGGKGTILDIVDVPADPNNPNGAADKVIRYQETPESPIEEYSLLNLQMQRWTAKERLNHAQQVFKDKKEGEKTDAEIKYKNAQTGKTNAETKMIGVKTVDGKNGPAVVDMPAVLDSDRNKNGVAELGIGTKPTGEGSETPRDEYGRTNSDILSQQKEAREVLKDNVHGAGRTMMMNIEKEEPALYKEANAVTDELILKGVTPAEAGNLATDIVLNAAEYKKKGHKNYIKAAMERFKRENKDILDGKPPGNSNKKPWDDE